MKLTNDNKNIKGLIEVCDVNKLTNLPISQKIFIIKDLELFGGLS